MYNPLSETLIQFHTDPPKKKSEIKYGQILAEKYLSTLKLDGGYYANRNKKISENRDFARGQQSMKPFLDMLNIDGKESFITLDWEPPKIAPKHFEVMIGRFMEYDERPTVKAVDSISKMLKKQRKDAAEFRMYKQGLLQELNGMAGVPLDDPTAFVPSDKEDLDLHFELEDYDDIEILFAKMIGDTLKDNNYEVFKRSALTDIAEAGYAVAYVYKDSAGVKRYKLIDTQSFFSSYSEKDDFSDAKMMGHIEMLRIQDARLEFPEITEKEWYEIYSKSPSGVNQTIPWKEDFTVCASRPYDDAAIEVMRFAVKTVDERYWVESTDKMNRVHLDPKTERPVYDNKKGQPSQKAVGQDKNLITKKIEVVYEGVYLTGSKKMIKWAMQKNMIKPHYALHEVLSPYCVIMPNNRQMTNIAMADRIKADVRAMTLTRMKLQQLIAKLRPDGVMIDVAGLTGVNLGLGEADMTPLQLQQVYDQTGVLYFSSVNNDDDERQAPPITPMQNDSSVTKVQSMIQTYNFHLESLRATIGTNEFAEGSAPNPKLGKGIMQNSVAISNRATHFIYSAFQNLLEQIAKRFAVLEWFDIVDGKRKQDYGVGPEDVVNRVFDLQITMGPTNDELLYIETQIEKAITAGIVTLDEVFRLRRVAKDNVLWAERLLARYEKQKKIEERQQHLENIQVQAKANEEVAIQKQQLANENAKISGEYKVKATKELTKARQDEFMQAMITAFISKGGDVPAQFQPFVQAYMENVMASIQLRMADAEMDMAGLQQQAQAMEQQAMEQQMAENQQQQS